MFTLKIAVTNAAFADNDKEVANLLTKLAAKGSELQTKGAEGTILDTYGNSVGSWRVR